jgi:hypothetical protein
VAKSYLPADPRRVYHKISILHLAYTVAHDILGRHARGEDVSRRNRQNGMTQLEWWRAMEFLKAAGVVVKGRLANDDISVLYSMLEAERESGVERIKRMRPPNYVLPRKKARGY